MVELISCQLPISHIWHFLTDDILTSGTSLKTIFAKTVQTYHAFDDFSVLPGRVALVLYFTKYNMYFTN